ncbi:MAG: F0F1 ATP synthase subunit epsilon [Neisseriaceae bacterium]|jgi:F-type H+-transporting ATPase subunit epsilon|nr:MAG: F0F1 ATP synthase subunit epsilon [Neisseriaceae bacterium]
MTTMQVELVSSEEQIFSGEAEYVVAPGSDGELGVYPHHISLINKLVPGLFRVKLPHQEEQVVYAISGGFLEVQSNKVTVLADVVERSENLDEARLLEEKRQAEERVKASGYALDNDSAKAYASLELVLAQLKALDYLRKNAHRG